MAPCSLPPYPFSTQIGPAHLIMHNRVEVEYNPATKCNRFVMPFVYSLFFHKPLRHTRKENKLTSALLHICIRLGKEKKRGGGWILLHILQDDRMLRWSFLWPFHACFVGRTGTNEGAILQDDGH